MHGKSNLRNSGGLRNILQDLFQNKEHITEGNIEQICTPVDTKPFNFEEKGKLTTTEITTDERE